MSRSFPVQRSHHRPLRRAFTLIEMLVVISLIVLLISMLMPSLGRSREAARNVSCLTAIRQVGLAMTYYADSNKSFLVPYKTPYEPTPVAYWGGLLAQGRYIETGPAFSCASYNPPTSKHLLATTASAGGNWFYTHYGINWQHLGSRYAEFPNSQGLGVPPLGPPTPKMTDIKKPSETIAALDAYGRVWEGTPNAGGICFVGDSDASSSTGAPDPRHLSNGINTLFADSHARSVRATNPFNPYTPDALTDADLNPNDNMWDIK
ncbi:MAG: type II secretion system protein [Phycisphaeraceae bacterium]